MGEPLKKLTIYALVLIVAFSVVGCTTVNVNAPAGKNI
jgi:predicted small secreted protein